MNLPEEFHQAQIELEVDLAEKGGLQRFKTVGDFQRWFDEEREFWRWMNEAPASNHHGAVSELISDYNRFNDAAQTALFTAKNDWREIRSAIKEQTSIFEDKSNSAETLEQAESQIEHHSNNLMAVIDRLSKALKHSITTEVVKSQCYLTRYDPSANFVKEMAEKESDEALFALDQIILEAKQSGERRRVELSGRMLATLYTRNLNRKVRHDNQAFGKAITTWSQELADFKSRYEAQEKDFHEISNRHASADAAWKERSDQMAQEFGEMRRASETELKSLKDTYDAFMQLEAPREYWEKKRIEHAKGKKVMGWLSAIGAVVGGVSLAFAAWYVLPENHPSDTIPWRQIGFFFLASTFVLWLVRLLVRLMLSHIHLYADAREREVMISTFLALIHRQESREGLQKEDIALVLAPIFRPSTTGVIKDDGGPSNLSDFIARLGGKG